MADPLVRAVQRFVDTCPHVVAVRDLMTKIGAQSNRQPSYATTLEEVMAIIRPRFGTV